MKDRTEFEEALTRALTRVDPPPTLARSLEKAVREQAVKVEQAQRRQRWAWLLPQPPRPRLAWLGGAVAAALVAGVFGLQQVHQRREQARADQQFALAVRLTDHALGETRAQLLRAGVVLPQ